MTPAKGSPMNPTTPKLASDDTTKRLRDAYLAVRAEIDFARRWNLSTLPMWQEAASSLFHIIEQASAP